MSSKLINAAEASLKQRVRELKSEIREREAELDSVSAALAALPGAKARVSPSKTNGAKPRRRRRGGKKVDRAAEFKALVSADPTISPTVAARQMGISSQQVHGVIKRLRDRGELTKGKSGYKLVKPSA